MVLLDSWYLALGFRQWVKFTIKIFNQLHDPQIKGQKNSKVKNLSRSYIQVFPEMAGFIICRLDTIKSNKVLYSVLQMDKKSQLSVSNAFVFWEGSLKQCEVVQQPTYRRASTSVRAVRMVSHGWRPGKLPVCFHRRQQTQWECAWEIQKENIHH